MRLRIAAVFVAYVIYRLPGNERLPAGVALGVGTFLVAGVAIDRLTRGRAGNDRIPEVVSLGLGTGLIVLGIALALR